MCVRVLMTFAISSEPNQESKHIESFLESQAQWDERNKVTREGDRELLTL